MTATAAVFERGRLTDWLLAELATALDSAGILVGDNVAPAAGAWAGGQPGEGLFVPYVVLTTAPAARNSQSTLGSPDVDDWTARYRLGSYGGVRSQIDWVADKARAAWYALPKGRIPLGPQNWKLYQYQVMTMGAITRIDQSAPPAWELVDDVALGITR